MKKITLLTIALLSMGTIFSMDKVKLARSKNPIQFDNFVKSSNWKMLNKKYKVTQAEVKAWQEAGKPKTIEEIEKPTPAPAPTITFDELYTQALQTNQYSRRGLHQPAF